MPPDFRSTEHPPGPLETTHVSNRSKLRRFLAGASLVGVFLVGGFVVAAPAQAVTCNDIGSSFTGNLNPGQCIHSSNNLYKLVMQGDGNLVSYRLRDSKVCFSAGTAGHPGAWAKFVYLGPNGYPIYSLVVYPKGTSTFVALAAFNYNGSISTGLNVSVGATHGQMYVGYNAYGSGC
jgi:hypothetical protein